jgi:hypothetical protein
MEEKFSVLMCRGWKNEKIDNASKKRRFYYFFPYTAQLFFVVVVGLKIGNLDIVRRHCCQHE